MSISSAFDRFMSEGFESAVDSSTKASWSGGGYSVEIFDDGDYRVLPNNSIGNLYDSPGLLLGVPSLTDDEWDEDETLRYYGNAEDALRECFTEAWVSGRK